VLDSDGYPTEASLGQLRDWPHTDIAGWLEFAQALWYYPEAATVDGGRYRFATGGWSGNEDVIGAMRGNALLWSLTWESSARGGLHLFSLPEDGPPVAQEHEGAEREG
jgi:hypothetical protein